MLTALVLCCAIGYFVVLPRFHEQVEEELTQVLSTEVADVLDRSTGGFGTVDAGEYRISLSDLERRVLGGTDNVQVEGVTLRTEGDDIVLGFSVQDASTEYRYTPMVSPEGYLEMGNMRGDGGFVQQLLAPESIGNAVEASINAYLQANGLYLEDVAVSGDDLVLVLGER